MSGDDRDLALIRRLADGRFHSGQLLADELGVTRAAICNRLHALGDRFGLEIQSVRGRGYRLSRPIELLDREAIAAHLPAATGCRLELVTSLDSTNARLVERARGGEPSGLVCLAEHQRAGRGRHGRPWITPFGGQLCLSLLWRFERAPAELGGLSLAIGVALVRALAALGVAGVGLKWPNDLLADGRKLAGILLELIGESGGPSQVIIGIGLNQRLSRRDGAAIDQPWIDLERRPGGSELSRNRLAAALIAELWSACETYQRDGLSPFLDDWGRHDLFRGRRVCLTAGSRRDEGDYQGIDPDGALRLATAEGLRRFQAGELSLREGG